MYAISLYVEELENLYQPKKEEFKNHLELLEKIKNHLDSKKTRTVTLFKEIAQRFEAALQSKTGWGKNEVLTLYYEVQTEVLSEYLDKY